MQIAIQLLTLVSLSVPGAPSTAPSIAPSTRPADRAESLTFNQVLSRAVRLNRDLKRAGLDFATAKQDLRAARGEYDTKLDAGISYRESSSAAVEGLNIQRLKSSTLEYSLSATQKLPTGGVITLGLTTSHSSDQSRYSFSGSTIESDTNTWDTALTLTVTHPLLKGIGLDRNLAAIRQARLARDAARWAVWAKAQAVVRDLLKAYLDVAEARAAVGVQQEVVVQAERDLGRVKTLLEVGRMAPSEIVDYEFAQAQQRRKLLEARTTWLQASLALWVQMGQRIQPGHGLSQTLISATMPADPFGSVVPTYNQATEAALKTSKSLAAALKELKIKNILLSSSKRDTWPTLDLSASFGPQGRATRFGTAHETMFRFRSLGWFVGLTFSYLVGNRAARAARAKARLAVRRKAVDIAEMRQTLVAEATRGVALLRLQRRLWQTTAAEVRLAAARLDNERKKHRAGRSSNFVLLQMQNDLVGARHKLFAARVGWLKQRVDLAALMGDLLGRYGLRMSKGADLRLVKKH
jgi:outer membrane protein TolC